MPYFVNMLKQTPAVGTLSFVILKAHSALVCDSKLTLNYNIIL